MSAIRRFARRIVARFKPDKIILFGSYAYGTPHADSDVDILVVKKTADPMDLAFQIRWLLRPNFRAQVVVRTPHSMKWRLAERESFLTDITTRGKVLYEAHGEGVDEQGRIGPAGGAKARHR